MEQERSARAVGGAGRAFLATGPTAADRTIEAQRKRTARRTERSALQMCVAWVVRTERPAGLAGGDLNGIDAHSVRISSVVLRDDTQECMRDRRLDQRPAQLEHLHTIGCAHI